MPIAGHCDIPSAATAVAINVTVTAPTAQGHLTLFPDGTAKPLVSMLNYGPGQTRASNAVTALSPQGLLDVFAGQTSGSVNVIIDVSGYFR